MPEKCRVVGCTKPSVAKGLCDTHRKQIERHGKLGTLRPHDWGDRRAHPAYTGWANLVRHHGQDIPESWKDFWKFIADVPERPEGRVSIFRPQPDEPWGPGNFFWRVSSVSADKRADSAEYMREWHAKMRAANPRYGKGQFLKRTYGVTLEWYDAKRAEQHDLCAICKNPETAIIGGRALELSVDHCHDKGHVRGLLCSDCNRAIGMLKDDPDILRAAIRYLENDTGDLV